MRQISCQKTSQDLENAMKKSEKYAGLIIMVCGFSARFANLPQEVPLEILNRTHYE